MRLIRNRNCAFCMIVNGRNQIMVEYFDRLMAGKPNNTKIILTEVILSVDVNDKQAALEDLNDKISVMT